MTLRTPLTMTIGGLGAATLATGLALAAPAANAQTRHGATTTAATTAPRRRASTCRRVPSRGHRDRPAAHGLPRLARRRRHLRARPAQRPGPGDQPGSGHAVGRAQGRPRPALRVRRLRRRRPGRRPRERARAEDLTLVPHRDAVVHQRRDRHRRRGVVHRLPGQRALPASCATAPRHHGVTPARPPRPPLAAHPGRRQKVDLTGAWVQGAGNNANGITTTPDGNARCS